MPPTISQLSMLFAYKRLNVKPLICIGFIFKTKRKTWKVPEGGSPQSHVFYYAKKLLVFAAKGLTFSVYFFATYKNQPT